MEVAFYRADELGCGALRIFDVKGSGFAFSHQRLHNFLGQTPWNCLPIMICKVGKLRQVGDDDSMERERIFIRYCGKQRASNRKDSISNPFLGTSGQPH